MPAPHRYHLIRIVPVLLLIIVISMSVVYIAHSARSIRDTTGISPSRHAFTNSVSFVYSVVAQDACEVLANADIVLYRKPQHGATVAGLLPAGARRSVVTQSTDGWIAVASIDRPVEPAWIAPKAPIVASTEGCTL